MSGMTPEEIEKDIELERAELAVNLAQLQDSLAIDAWVEKGKDYARTHARDVGRAVVDQVKRNPLPMALIGAGLAWMAFGGGASTTRPTPVKPPRPAYAPVKPRVAADRPDYRTEPADVAAARLSEQEPDWMENDMDRTPAQPQWVPADDVWTQPGDNK